MTVYAAAAACEGAKRVLGSEGGGVESVRVRVHCLPGVERGGRFDLATVGVNARRASEDSSSIAYIGEIEPTATRFSETILEEAGIAQLPRQPGANAMHEILDAIRQVDPTSGSLRESVSEQLQG